MSETYHGTEYFLSTPECPEYYQYFHLRLLNTLNITISKNTKCEIKTFPISQALSASSAPSQNILLNLRATYAVGTLKQRWDAVRVTDTWRGLLVSFVAVQNRLLLAHHRTKMTTILHLLYLWYQTFSLPLIDYHFHLVFQHFRSKIFVSYIKGLEM